MTEGSVLLLGLIVIFALRPEGLALAAVLTVFTVVLLLVQFRDDVKGTESDDG